MQASVRRNTNSASAGAAGRTVTGDSSIAYPALPERRVTDHSEDMGCTIGLFAGRAKCPGRSVIRWIGPLAAMPVRIVRGHGTRHHELGRGLVRLRVDADADPFAVAGGHAVRHGGVDRSSHGVRPEPKNPVGVVVSFVGSPRWK